MFTELPISGPERRPTRTRWTFLISFAAEAIVLAIVLLIPLLKSQALPKLWVPNGVIYIWAQTPPPMPLKPAIVPETIQRPAVVPFSVPRAIPHGITSTPAVPPDLGPNSPTMPGAIPGGSSDGGSWIVPNPMPAPPEPARPKRVRVGGNVRPPRLIHLVRAVYPPIARETRVQGNVLLRAVIATDGTIEDLQYVSGPALLMGAAMDAVRQWRYEPTLLNGQPVEVEATIQVKFTLNGTTGH